MRTNVNLLRNALTVLSVCCIPGFSDDRTLDAIRNKAQAESRVMDDAFFLSDVYGPRFLASPSSHDAADWVKKRLEEIGMTGARLEGIPVEDVGFRWSQRGWSYQRFSLNMLEPQYAKLLISPARPIPLAAKPQFLRLTDQQLSELATTPGGPSGAPALQAPSSAARPPSLAEIRSNFNQLFRFLREEGVVAMIN
jgi:hypothetical protein